MKRKLKAGRQAQMMPIPTSATLISNSISTIVTCDSYLR